MLTSQNKSQWTALVIKKQNSPLKFFCYTVYNVFLFCFYCFIILTQTLLYIHRFYPVVTLLLFWEIYFFFLATTWYSLEYLLSNACILTFHKFAFHKFLLSRSNYPTMAVYFQLKLLSFAYFHWFYRHAFNDRRKLFVSP